MLRWPEPLRSGDRVRVIAPGGPFEPERLASGLALIRAAGLVPVMRDDLSARARYLAGDDTRRRRELEEALADKSARAIWVARGGYGATRLLPGLAERLRTGAPRWLIGFSDVTALHCAWSAAGYASLHGANVTTLVSWSAEARRELFGLLFAPSALAYRGAAANGRADVVTGPLRGGNLTMLTSLVGTGHLPSFAGAIVLVEDVGERPYRLDRQLVQLWQAGAFAGARGVAVGQLTDCEEPHKDGAPAPGYTAREVVAAVLAEIDVPVLMDVAIGHEPSSRPVVLGARATLDLGRQELVVEAPSPGAAAEHARSPGAQKRSPL